MNYLLSQRDSSSRMNSEGGGAKAGCEGGIRKTEAGWRRDGNVVAERCYYGIA